MDVALWELVTPKVTSQYIQLILRRDDVSLEDDKCRRYRKIYFLTSPL